MRKTIVTGIAALVFAAAGFAGSARAQCVWTGGIWACRAAPAIVVRPYAVIYPAPNPAFGRYGWNWWGPDQPNANPGAGTGN